MIMASLINGKAASEISITDRGFNYGDGLFETIKIRNGKPVYWQRHIDRLSSGCKRLKISPQDTLLLLAEATSLTSSLDQGVLKITITRGQGGRGYAFPDRVQVTRILAVYPEPDYPSILKLNGIKLKTCKTRLPINPLLAGIKHLNRLEQVLARSEFNPPEYHEGLMLDREGRPVEGVMSNIFWVRSGQLFTPALDNCGVEGVIRSIIIELAEKNSIACKIAAFNMDDLMTSDEVFMTNSLIGIWSVRQIDEVHFSSASITQRLALLLDAHERQEILPC